MPSPGAVKSDWRAGMHRRLVKGSILIIAWSRVCVISSSFVPIWQLFNHGVSNVSCHTSLLGHCSNLWKGLKRTNWAQFSSRTLYYTGMHSPLLKWLVKTLNITAGDHTDLPSREEWRLPQVLKYARSPSIQKWLFWLQLCAIVDEAIWTIKYHCLVKSKGQR